MKARETQHQSTLASSQESAESKELVAWCAMLLFAAINVFCLAIFWNML